MSRFDKYKKAVQEEIEFRENQVRLHDKHENISEDTVIIEKSNMIKFLLNFLRRLLKTIFGCAVIVLTTIGILTLLYPNTRMAFFIVINQIIDNIKELVFK